MCMSGLAGGFQKGVDCGEKGGGDTGCVGGDGSMPIELSGSFLGKECRVGI